MEVVFYYVLFLYRCKVSLNFLRKGTLKYALIIIAPAEFWPQSQRGECIIQCSLVSQIQDLMARFYC